MNTTQKIGTLAGALWFVGTGAVYIAGAVFTGTSKGREIYALVAAPALLIWKMTDALSAITKWFKE